MMIIVISAISSIIGDCQPISHPSGCNCFLSAGLYI